MTANVDAMVREGISAYRAGKKDEARTLLLKVVELDPRNEQGWLWLSGLLDSEEEQRICLENVLVVNPGNEHARQGVKMLDQKLAGGAPEETQLPSPTSSPFTTDFGDSSGEQAANTAPPETSSASAWRAGDEILSQNLDDWVTNLNLTGESDDSPPANLDAPTGTPAFAVSPFADDPDDELSSGDATEAFTDGASGILDDDDDFLESLDDKAQATSPAPRTSLFDDDEEVMFDGGSFFGEDPAEYFRYIPQDIKPGKSKKPKQGYPAGAVMGLLVMVLLNIGAAAFLVMNLMG